MNDGFSLPAELHRLADAAIDGRLTSDDRTRLEQLIAGDAATRRRYVEYVSLNATLQWSAARSVPSLPQPAEAVNGRRTIAWLPATVAALAASLVVVVWYSFREVKPIATIAETKSCRWDSGTLPTEAGAELRPGRLRLAEGLARFTFTSGAEVTIEGPADLELISAMSCRLHSGQLAATMPPSAHGFIVETPSSVLTDLGTEFGVKVHNGTTSDVQVFSGRVDVWHRQSGQTSAMVTGPGIRFTPDVVRPLNPDTDLKADSPAATRPVAGTRSVQITTAQGRGRDAFVMAMDTIPSDRQSDTLLLVKVNEPKMAQWDRMAYLGIDLSSVRSQHILDAELTVTFAPTGMGFAALCRDATFGVYGITDDRLDEWDDTALKWPTAPANLGKQRGLDPARSVKLGTFVVPQGLQNGTNTIGGAALVNFLVQDRNQFVTFVIARETRGVGGSDLVHGIASRRHPSLPPPTLRLTVTDPK